jgi:hypothetical protein
MPGAWTAIPKKWFLIGILLPGWATMILSFLPDLSEDGTAKKP